MRKEIHNPWLKPIKVRLSDNTGEQDLSRFNKPRGYALKSATDMTVVHTRWHHLWRMRGEED